MHVDSHDPKTEHADHGHDHDHHGHCDHDHDHGTVPEPRKGRRGILLSPFGCALPHTHKHYDLYEEEVRERYPDMDVRWAFTANRVRAKLHGRGIERLSVAEALSKMIDDGISHVAVQSLHTLPGVEYDWTARQAEAMRHPRKGLTGVTIGAPLLQSMDDLERAAAVIENSLLPQCTQQDGVILVGHGTYHQSHTLYMALESLLLRTIPNVAMGTLMDSDSPAVLGQRFIAKGVKRVFLIPFMCVPGHHVHVDLFGDQKHAWQTILSATGLEVTNVYTGSLEHHGFRNLWHDHLAKAVATLGDG